MRKLALILGILTAAVWAAPIPTYGRQDEASRSCISDILAGIELAKRPDYDYYRQEVPFRDELADKPACVKRDGDRLPGDRQPPPDEQIQGPVPEHLQK